MVSPLWLNCGGILQKAILAFGNLERDSVTRMFNLSLRLSVGDSMCVWLVPR